MAQQGQLLFPSNFIVACTGLLKPGGSATKEKPEGTFYISILFKKQFYNYQYFLDGNPIERLNQLTTLVAEKIMFLIRTCY